jgi:hypothetical protein
MLSVFLYRMRGIVRQSGVGVNPPAPIESTWRGKGSTVTRETIRPALLMHNSRPLGQLHCNMRPVEYAFVIYKLDPSGTMFENGFLLLRIIQKTVAFPQLWHKRFV